MRQVEKHIISKEHKFYKEIDDLMFKSKNLYNVCNYVIRQNYFNYIKLSGNTDIVAKDNQFNKNPEYVYSAITLSGGCCNLKYLNNVYVDKMLIKSNQFDYRELPAKVSKQVLIQLNNNWKGFFVANNDKKINPSKYKGAPRIPKYKHKTKGRNKISYELGAISRKELKKGIIKLSQTNIEIPFINSGNTLNEVRIVKNNLSYTIEVVYEIKIKELKKNDKFLGIDIGIKNLMTVVNNFNERPIIYNGKPIKSINQFYNKELVRMKSELPKGIYTSEAIKRFVDTRNNKIDYEFHNITDNFSEYCELHDVSRVVVGYNPLWKQEVNLGDQTNQNFVGIPFLKLINQLRYKLLIRGIELIVKREDYTSKCSFLDGEKVCKHDVYMGKRIKRGLFRCSDGFLINADVNAAFNILLKVVPDFKVRNRGLAVNPIRVKLEATLV
jgi:putative transposase